MEIRDEYDDANLGDERLNRRLERLAEQLAKVPATSFPRAAASDAELEATYRFLGNDRVSPEEILAPHIRRTLARMANVGAAVVGAHETTEVQFGGAGRGELGRVGWGESLRLYAPLSLGDLRDDRRDSLGRRG